MTMLNEIRSSLDIEAPVEITAKESFPSCFSVSELAACSMAGVGAAIAQLKYEVGLSQNIETSVINQRLASLWFAASIKPIDWTLPPIWDEVSGDYQTHDGWIRLHCNLPHHKTAALSVLKQPADREKLKQCISELSADDLESKIVSAGGPQPQCAQ